MDKEKSETEKLFSTKKGEYCKVSAEIVESNKRKTDVKKKITQSLTAIESLKKTVV